MAKAGFLRNMAFSALALGEFIEELEKENGANSVFNFIESHLSFDEIHRSVFDMIFAMGYVKDKKQIEPVFLKRNMIF
jgi:hypothetical protein